MKKWIFVCVLALLVVGCIRGVDPNTGEPTWRVDPNVAGDIEGYAQTGITIMGLLGAFFPVLIPATTLAGGIFATWRKMKPKVTAAQTRAELCHTSTASLVTAIDEYKKIDPDGWEKLKARIKVGPEVENIIRAIRNLPPIE